MLRLLAVVTNLRFLAVVTTIRFVVLVTLSFLDVVKHHFLFLPLVNTLRFLAVVQHEFLLLVVVPTLRLLAVIIVLLLTVAERHHPNTLLEFGIIT